MKRGQRLAAEREFGHYRSFGDLVQQEPCLRELARNAKLAAKRHKRGKAWNRCMTVAMWTVVVLTWVLVLMVLCPWLIQAMQRWLAISAH